MTSARPKCEIAFGTDFSQCSQRAREIAVQYARRLDATLHVVHVAGWLHAGECRSLLDHELSTITGIPVFGHHLSGSTAPELARFAFEIGAVLIVIGTHGRTGLGHAFLGSTAERVLRAAHCPVLVVPPPEWPPSLAVPEASPGAGARRCLVCSGETPELICEPCRGRIRGEAIMRQQEATRRGH